jgi:hypothetical protein
MNSTFILDEWSYREQKVMELLKIDRKSVDPKEDLNVQNHPSVPRTNIPIGRIPIRIASDSDESR